MAFRLSSLLLAVVGVLSACQDNSGEEYVKTVKGDMVRKRDAEAANLPTRSDGWKQESSDGERDE